MIIPFDQIEADTLDNLIQAFVLREGTEYGETEYSMEEKVAQVKQQLINKQAVIVFSELHETVDIVPSDQFPLTDE